MVTGCRFEGGLPRVVLLTIVLPLNAVLARAERAFTLQDSFHFEFFIPLVPASMNQHASLSEKPESTV